MNTSRKFGLLMMVGGPILGLVYVLGIAVAPLVALEFLALAAAAVLVGLVTWIGYAMLTEPESARPVASDSDLPDLEPETLNTRTDSQTPLSRSRFSSVKDCSIGEGTEVRDQVNLYRCIIGRDCKIESFVYIEEGVVIGDRCKIKPNVFIPTGVRIGDDVFIGPNATFTNDKYPRTSGEWKLLETKVGGGTAIGAHSVVLPGVSIGSNCIVGAGAVVTKDVPDYSVVIGNPARIVAKSTVRERAPAR
jgi:UDP-2-acetamido-3-amino-2,3-dideoxy-glucuronate N-acetyltransferase